MKVAVLMGSKSDLPIVKECLDVFKKFSVGSEIRVMSAHRTPEAVSEFVKGAKDNGFGVIIAAAGKAAHLAGAVAANTSLPVVGLPILGSAFNGLDSLLSTVQMPSGVPVATVAVNCGTNAALLAVQILAVSDEKLYRKLTDHKEEMKKKIEEEDLRLRSETECP
jgi:phosphoribosylaminoimidazole carboxylase, PurE protein